MTLSTRPVNDLHHSRAIDAQLYNYILNKCDVGV